MPDGCRHRRRRGALSPIAGPDATPGSATALLRTFVGLHLRELGDWIPISALTGLLADAGISPTSVRSAVSRVSANPGQERNLFLAEKRDGVAGYRLDPAAVTGLERGDRRIFSYRVQAETDPWCLISYSLPEVDRPRRTQLRRGLAGLGFGAVADGLWIAPAHLRPEAEELLDMLSVRGAATIFITETPSTPGSFAEAAAQWWDLEKLAARHEEFVDRYQHLVPDLAEASAPGTAPDAQKPRSGSAPTEPAELRSAFLTQLRCVDDWKAIPYVDPGLPPSALPADWPGSTSVDLFGRIRTRCAAPAAAHVEAAVVHGN
ncbi:PaaX family transcriptional regulator C-terminal domain-containing protein [Brevibacterium sp.]|uniref:PaaX family transcriptional regulator n=1 Tax=Brevibacterium sp. TaxID=1701 RepID=UPI0028113167|nr:PaaX family transcriptional regulator C-terminal domain-containing protein [Brevibacterium sp.]